MPKTRKRSVGAPASLDDTSAMPSNGDGLADPERISMRAYELYLARGGSDGQAWDDWLAAERELAFAAMPPTRDRTE